MFIYTCTLIIRGVPVSIPVNIPVPWNGKLKELHLYSIPGDTFQPLPVCIPGKALIPRWYMYLYEVR